MDLWGTISSSGFDTRDGEVVCRQLGHQHPRESDHLSYFMHVDSLSILCMIRCAIIQ